MGRTSKASANRGKAKAPSSPKGGKAKAKPAHCPTAATTKAQPTPPVGPWPADASPWGILGINLSDGLPTIHKAFLQLSRIWHPGKGGHTAVFARISAARDELVRFLGPETTSLPRSYFEPTTPWEQDQKAAQETIRQMMAGKDQPEFEKKDEEKRK